MIIPWINHVTARSLELRRLRHAMKSHQPPASAELESLSKLKAIWRIGIPTQNDRFMSVSSGAIDEERYVVQLDAEVFYRAWLESSPAFRQRRSSDCLCRAQMHADYKFKSAAKGFSHGVTNPVPLAEAGAHRSPDGHVYVGFTNGVTRTFWLLANHCPAFPVKVYGLEGATILHETAGLGARPTPLSELFSHASYEIHRTPCTNLGTLNPKPQHAGVASGKRN